MGSDRTRITAEGKDYDQAWLPSEDAMALHMLCIKSGFSAIVEALAALQGKDLQTAMQDAEAIGGVLAAAHTLVQSLTIEDVKKIRSMVEKVTFLVRDDSHPIQVSALPNHFADSRDMPRLYVLLAKSIAHQLSPFTAAQCMSQLRAALGVTRSATPTT